MYERFTPDAKTAVVHAEQAARALAHATVGPEHLLLGLLDAPGTAARVLGSLGLDADRGAEEVERIVGRGTRASSGSVPFTPRSRSLLEHAARQAMSLGHDEVGTEHVLLALASDADGVAGRVLATVAHPGVVRDAVLRGMEEAPAEAVAAAAEPAIDAVPVAVSVRVGDDVRVLLRRAAGLALAADAAEITVEHVRRALDAETP